MRYVVIDTMNMFFRCKHQAAKGTDAWTKTGFAIHLTLNSAAKVFREHKGDHVVFALEGGRSWRKDIYPPYKRTRDEAKLLATDDEIEEDEMFFDAYGDLVAFLDKRSNCTVIAADQCEGDDIIAHWIQSHPNDEHIISSSDTDFYQLLAPKVTQYNGVSSELHTIEGIFNDDGGLVLDKKTQLPKPAPDPEWCLFSKCIRGDKSDNVFSSFPGAREKGTKNKVGMREAFADRVNKGYAWNNFMLQRWLDHEQKEHKVIDDYQRNVNLIDLRRQPDHVRLTMDMALVEAYEKPAAGAVGIYLMKFCVKYELQRIQDYPDNITKMLMASLPEIE